MCLQVLVIRVDLSLRATAVPATPWVTSWPAGGGQQRGAGGRRDSRAQGPALGEHVSTSQGQPAQRQPFFAALCSQPGQWDPSVNEGPPKFQEVTWLGSLFPVLSLESRTPPLAG